MDHKTAIFGFLFVTATVLGSSTDSPVADAAQRNNIETVRSLLKQGVDVNASQGDGMTALHWAALNGNADIARMLLYGGANVKATTRDGAYTPLLIAAKMGNAPVAAMLLN